jgi:hypothetical protein
MRIETLEEFLHRVTIEQQEADRYDRQQKQNHRVKCAPAQDARRQLLIQIGDMK